MCSSDLLRLPAAPGADRPQQAGGGVGRRLTAAAALPLGDVNGDGLVNGVDPLYLLAMVTSIDANPAAPIWDETARWPPTGMADYYANATLKRSQFPTLGFLDLTLNPSGSIATARPYVNDVLALLQYTSGSYVFLPITSGADIVRALPPASGLGQLAVSAAPLNSGAPADCASVSVFFEASCCPPRFPGDPPVRSPC